MKKSYFPPEGIWLKGNIHSHSTVSDGKLSPQELTVRYKKRGYDFLSLTDHNVLVSHSALSDEGIILLGGLEHDLEYSADKCIHMVGLTASGKEQTNYPCRRYSCSEISDQALLDMMKADGQFVSLAHPLWSRMEMGEVEKLSGFDAIEVYNNGTEHLCHGGNAELIWELLLRSGRRVLATAVDDVHGEEDLFGGWIWLLAREKSAGAILEALKAGQFYASSGPVIHDFGVEDGKAYADCSSCREIHFVTYPPRGKSFFADGEPLTRAEHCLNGRESYVRVVCVDEEGRSAWSNPIFFDNE